MLTLKGPIALEGSLQYIAQHFLVPLVPTLTPPPQADSSPHLPLYSHLNCYGYSLIIQLCWC